MYCLETVIAEDEVLRRLAGDVVDARIVPLHGSLAMLPMTDEYFDAVTVRGAAGLEGFWKLPAGFGGALAACSELGPVAYVEADHLAVGERPPAAGSPISQALRALGVRRGSHLDEFDAAGLGRHRRTEDWLARPNE